MDVTLQGTQGTAAVTDAGVDGLACAVHRGGVEREHQVFCQGVVSGYPGTDDMVATKPDGGM